MLDRLNEAMTHVERHLDRRVDVAELARIALTSEYHLRRMFSALAGMPLSEYVRRRRLTVAAAEVVAGERTLLDIAVRYGYGSTEAFTRAFRAVHGVGPGEARRGGAVLRSQQRLSFRLVVEGSAEMRYRVVEKPGTRLVGWRVRVPLVHEGMNPAIVAFRRGLDQAAVARLATLSDQEPAGLVDASDQLDQSREEGTELDYWHGVVTDADVPLGLASLTLPAGTWAVFDTSGEFPTAVQQLWRDVFTQWFPANPYRSRPGPEISRTRISADGTRADFALWIPVERVAA
ncbi:AraC family transcriptional regulator [Micromonospora sp. KC723]|uniref:AraC family transcriptional regulator n=1 Tax=Micromonospora sp. KC723 TaxID=2530381 RepID=UPI0010482D7B|nr:AraC family transcriptional regulator [Micromonospora sp. KC723]TDB76397.1 AraC family transcriptional regulator [Micromonospora sp. KC723]